MIIMTRKNYKILSIEEEIFFRFIMLKSKREKDLMRKTTNSEFITYLLDLFERKV